MSLLFVVFTGLVIISQACNLVFWILKTLGIIEQDVLSTEAIIKDLGYTMEQYNSSDYIKYLIASEWCKRFKNS